jgi:hypothetical protein
MAFNKGPKLKGAPYVTPIGKLSFPNVLTPALKYESKTEYEFSTVIMWKEGEDLSKFEGQIQIALTEAFGPDQKKWPKNIVTPLKDQAELIEKAEAKSKPTTGLQAGAMYARFKTSDKYPPKVWDSNNQTVTPETNEKNEVVYGGANAAVSGNLKVTTIKGPVPITYVTAYMQGVKIFGKGEKIGGAKTSVEDFSAVQFDGDNVDEAFNDML